MNGIIAQAKMRAAADFSHRSRLRGSHANTYHLEVWNATAGCWQTEGENPSACTSASSPVQQLAIGVTFGFGTVALPPRTLRPDCPGAACGTVAAVQDWNPTIANTAWSSLIRAAFH